MAAAASASAAAVAGAFPGRSHEPIEHAKLGHRQRPIHASRA